ncbi:MAG: DUF4139 domain-containing protein, partial [bacterium]|nr:DUF4139 domain-containing protein [bacterium]
RNTIESGKEGKKVTIAIEKLPVEQTYIALPRLSKHVFLRAKMKNSSKLSLMAGPVNLFHDGTFVNNTRLDFKNPGESFEYPLGIDKAMKVKWAPLDLKGKRKGTFKKKKYLPGGYKMTISSMRRTPVTVLVQDSIPVSLYPKIKLESTELNPKPTNLDEKKGFITWSLKLKPG